MIVIKTLLLTPPIAFLIILSVVSLFSYLLSRLSYRNGVETEGKTKPYACGEDVECSKVQPDYTQFFPFAFFFTIMHVLALIISTIPPEAIKNSGIAVLYIGGCVSGLFILLRK